MIIPGANVLGLALSIIARQKFQYKAFVSRATADNGMLVSNYDDPVAMSGSVQAVPRNLFANMGLEFNKSYFWFYVERSVVDVTRDVSGDQFLWNGGTFQALSKTPWSAIDGWDAVLTVQVPNAG